VGGAPVVLGGGSGWGLSQPYPSLIPVVSWAAGGSKKAFRRLVREIAQDYRQDLRWQSAAVATLQEGAEAYLVTVLYQSNLLAIHSKRETLMAKDIELQQVLMADNGFKNTYTGTAKTT